MAAASLDAAYGELRRQGLRPIALKPETARAAPRRHRFPARILMAWSARLQTMLEAGIPIDRALTLLSEAHKDPMAPISTRLLRAVRSGETFADAIAAEQVFPATMAGMLQASERTSDVAGAMRSITQMLRDGIEMRRTITQALVYPAFLFLVAIASLILMLGFVVPQFEPLLADAPDLPMLAGIVLSASAAMRAFAMPLILLAIAAIVLGVFLSRSPAMGRALYRMALGMPGLGKILRDLAVANLLRNLATFQKAEVPVLDALALTATAGPAGPQAEALAAAGEDLAKGGRLSASLTAPAFPNDVIDMLKAGEESAAVAPMLFHIAEMCETRARAAIKQMLTLLEPAIILVVGVLIGGVVFSIFQAILSVNDIVF